MFFRSDETMGVERDSNNGHGNHFFAVGPIGQFCCGLCVPRTKDRKDDDDDEAPRVVLKVVAHKYVLVVIQEEQQWL